MKENRMPSRKTFRPLLAAVAAAALTGSAAFTRADEPVKTSPAVAQVEALATVMKDVGKAVEPSVVSIEVKMPVQAAGRTELPFDEETLKQFFPDTDGDGEPDIPNRFRFREAPLTRPAPIGQGSGVILDATADKAYILTNNHVAGGTGEITVVLHDGRRLQDVRVVGTDPRSDLALLEVTAPNLKAIRWGDSESLEKGDIVMAFGAPFGYVGSMTQGIVSAKGRQAGILGQDGYEYFIQTDCSINPGNSGGPLVNTRGEIVGINTAIASRTGTFSGLGFAVPSNLARFVYDQLKDHGKVARGFLGVRIQDTATLREAQLARLNLGDRKGIYVGESTNGTPAFGKLLPNDVIVSFDGKPIENMGEFRLKVASTKPGTDMRLGVIRKGKEVQVTVTLGELPDNPEQTAVAARDAAREPANADIGVVLATPSPARLRGRGLPSDATGALVTAVKDGSLAQMAGLAVGDLVTQIGDTEVTDADTALQALKEVNLKDGIELLVVTRTGTKSIFVQSE